jgi:ribosome-binding protein aMBF1 (putative translation factor)
MRLVSLNDMACCHLLVAAPGETARYPLPSVSRDERRQQHLRQVADLVRAARQRAGLTQEELAARMSQAGEPTSRSQVSMWELGSPSGHMPSTAKLLTIFEVTRTPDPVRDAAERQILDLETQLADLRSRLGS